MNLGREEVINELLNFYSIYVLWGSLSFLDRVLEHFVLPPFKKKKERLTTNFGDSVAREFSADDVQEASAGNR